MSVSSSASKAATHQPKLPWQHRLLAQAPAKQSASKRPRRSSLPSIPTSLSMLLPSSQDDQSTNLIKPLFSRHRLETSAHLEKLSKTLIAALNARHIDQSPTSTLESFAKNHIFLPQFKAKFDNATTYTWSEFLIHLQEPQRFCPHSTIHIIYVPPADLHEGSGTGSVSLLTEVVCWKTGLRRIQFSVHKWRKRRGVWMCYELNSVRGVDFTSCPAHHHRENVNVDGPFPLLERRESVAAPCGDARRGTDLNVDFLENLD